MDAQKQYAAAAERVFAGDDAPRDNPLFGLGTELLSEFNVAQSYRREIEQRWLTDLRQYKGIYEPEEEAAMTGSKAWFGKTRIKVDSTDSRMLDLLFPANRDRNYSVDATPDPKVAPEIRARLKQLLTQAMGQPPGPDAMKAAIADYVDAAAKKMSNRIDDQLCEAKYRTVCGKVLHSGNLYGTGILKGPLVERRTRIGYVWDGRQFVQRQRSFAAPFVSYVPLWRWYPDMAVTELVDCRFAWEHHRLSRAALAELANRKTFNGQLIRQHIGCHEDGYIKLMPYEVELQNLGEATRITGNARTGQYDVYERWGWLSAELLASAGVTVPRDRMHEAFFANIWMLPDGEIIKAVLAPIEGVEWPYHLYHFSKDETSLFGSGLSHILRDPQATINAAVRMLLDNSATTAGDMFEVFVPAFPPGADLTTIHPGKVFPRTGGDFQYPAVRPIRGDNHAQQLLPIVELFDSNCDESSGVPKYSYGDNPQNGAAATMGGLSMLLGQANMSLKGLVVNFDEGITEPFISALYHWNMKFSRDDSIKGDFDVKARGASSLVAKEVKAQLLSQFGATLQPEERPFVNFQKLAMQKAEVQDMAEIIKTEDEVQAEQNSTAAQQQAQLQQMQAQLAIQTMSAQVGKLQAEIARIGADAQRLTAETLRSKVDSEYAAMQAGAVVAANPGVAPIGDAILREAGWVDAPAQGGDPVGAAAQAAPPGAAAPLHGTNQPPSPFVGERAGIETAAVPQ